MGGAKVRRVQLLIQAGIWKKKPGALLLFRRATRRKKILGIPVLFGIVRENHSVITNIAWEVTDNCGPTGKPAEGTAPKTTVLLRFDLVDSIEDKAPILKDALDKLQSPTAAGIAISLAAGIAAKGQIVHIQSHSLLAKFEYPQPASKVTTNDVSRSLNITGARKNYEDLFFIVQEKEMKKIRVTDEEKKDLSNLYWQWHMRDELLSRLK